MKLISCHIENFGKLKDLSVDFTEGLNIVLRENGWGKSTFAAFIRAMFYGLSGDRKRDLSENERKRYKPWQGGVFGGQLVFEAGGKTYEVSRTFKDREGLDEFELRDARTGLPSADFSERLGEELFQLNRESFMRTLFISQADCETAVNADIHARVGNLTDSLNDMKHFEGALSRLTASMNALTPNRKTGSVAKREEEIGALRRKLLDSENLESEWVQKKEEEQGLNEKEEDLKQELKSNKAMQEAAQEALAVRSARLSHDRLKEAVQKKQEAVDRARAVFTADVPTTEETEAMIRAYTGAIQYREAARANALSEEEKLSFVSLSDTAPERERILKEPLSAGKEEGIAQGLQGASQESSRQSSVYRIFPVFMGVFLIFGIIMLTQKQWIFGAVSLAAGAVFAVLWALEGKRSRERLLEAEKEAEKEAQRRAEIVREKTEARMQAEADERRLQELKEKAARREASEASWKEAYAPVEAFLEQCGEESSGAMEALYRVQVSDPMEALIRLRNRADDLEDAKRDLNAAKQELSAFESGEEYRNSLKTESQAEDLPDLDTLKTRAESLEEAREALRQERRLLDKRLEQLEDSLDVREEDREKLEGFLEKQAEEREKFRLLGLAKDRLEAARTALTERYAEPLLKSFAGFYEMISGESASAYRMDANTNLTALEEGKQREIEALSSGFRDLVGICLRTALAEAMFQEEKPFLIMDDPFTNLDDEKLQRGKAFLKKLAEEHQIIFLTCSKVRA